MQMERNKSRKLKRINEFDKKNEGEKEKSE